jgi:hypothetical protein
LYAFFFGAAAISLKENIGESRAVKNTFTYGFLKWLIAGLICLEVFYPFIKERNFNSETAKLPFLHGAYKVVKSASNSDTTNAALKVKMFFIHKDGYFIFQDADDKSDSYRMTDYRLQYDTVQKLLLLTDYQMRQTKVVYDYSPGDSVLILHFAGNETGYTITGKAIDWRKLPALEKGFHWTVD